jgi:hypothetical protein
MNNNYNGTQLLLGGNTCDPKFIKKKCSKWNTIQNNNN